MERAKEIAALIVLGMALLVGANFAGFTEPLGIILGVGGGASILAGIGMASR